MKIASHHLEGTREYQMSTALGRTVQYTPSMPWPEDCTVQWGHGIIPANPFFEAFIPGTFYRGDGASIEEAEKRAFAQYEKEKTCNHLWGRQRPGRDLYHNGAGWCRHCGAFRSNMFKPVFLENTYRKPLSLVEVSYLEMIQEDDDEAFEDLAPSSKKYIRALKIRDKIFGRVKYPASTETPHKEGVAS